MTEPTNLAALLGQRVTVTGPNGSKWAGTLTALADQPTAVIDLPDGGRVSLPQSHTYTVAPRPEDELREQLAAATARAETAEAALTAVREQIAHRIRAELVCCYLYGQVNDGVSEEEAERRFEERKRDIRLHDLCYWGEASARIAEDATVAGVDCPDPIECEAARVLAALDGTPEPALAVRALPVGTGAAEAPAEEEPHVCKPGATVYFCPTVGEVESSCHGGFDVCCSAPELHRPCDHRDPKLLACRPHDLAVVCACGTEVTAGLRPHRR